MVKTGLEKEGTTVIKSFGTYFSYVMERLQMQTFHRNDVDRSPIRFNSGISQTTNLSKSEKRLKIREFVSWSVCFAVVCGLTGLLKYLKVGITMDTITSALFYLSLAGLIYFITRIIMMSKSPVQLHSTNLHELN
ncbi:MAG TPA: hypothetical protein VGI38_07950 [Puia sp.]